MAKDKDDKKTKSIKPRHTLYYKSEEEKEKIDTLAEESDISASKYIYKILKEAGCFK